MNTSVSTYNIGKTIALITFIIVTVLTLSIYNSKAVGTPEVQIYQNGYRSWQSTVSPGDTVTINYTSQNANACYLQRADNGVITNLPDHSTSGSFTASYAVAGTHNWYIYCTSADGEISNHDTVSMVVNHPISYQVPNVLIRFR